TGDETARGLPSPENRVRNPASTHPLPAVPRRQLVNKRPRPPMSLIELRETPVQSGVRSDLVGVAIAGCRVVGGVVDRFRERVVGHESEPLSEPAGPLELQ